MAHNIYIPEVHNPAHRHPFFLKIILERELPEVANLLISGILEDRSTVSLIHKEDFIVRKLDCNTAHYFRHFKEAWEYRFHFKGAPLATFKVKCLNCEVDVVYGLDGVKSPCYTEKVVRDISFGGV